MTDYTEAHRPEAIWADGHRGRGGPFEEAASARRSMAATAVRGLMVRPPADYPGGAEERERALFDARRQWMRSPLEVDPAWKVSHHGRCCCGEEFGTSGGTLALCHLLRGHARVMA